MRSGTKLFCTNINLSLFTTYITLNPTLPMQINIVCYIYSPNSNGQELLGIKTQMLKMTVTLQKRWKQGRKLQKKNSWILVAILAVYLFPLTSITAKATVTGTSASCRDGSRKLVTRMDLYLELVCYFDKRTLQRTPSQMRQDTRSAFGL